MPSLEDWVNCPLDIIQRLFDVKEDVHDNKVREYFSKQLHDRETYNWVPSINDIPLHNLKNNTLVRFRCMVQDMYDPEFYLGTYEVLDKTTGYTKMVSGKYKDIADCGPQQTVNIDSPKNVTMDRQTLYCVPIPGEANWVKEMYREGSRVDAQASGHKTRCQKRALDDEESNSSEMEVEEAEPTQKKNAMESEASGGDKTVTGEADGSGDKAKPSQPTDLNFPLPGEKGPACIVKVYDSKAELKLNDTVEFVGILSNHPALVSFPEDESKKTSAFLDAETMDSFDNNSTNPPPSLVPRLHAILINSLQHNNPILPNNVEAELENNELRGFLSEVRSIREEMVAMLEKALFGDRLAAEYLLCNLLSNVYARQDVVSLGKFALNLSGCPSSAFPSLLSNLLQDMVSKVYFLPMSLTNMNTMSFLPRKDYVANRLTTGILQLSERTHLVVDETALQPGQLETKGVANITALGNMISWQKLEYDFNFHKQDFLTNIIPLVISEGKSILKCDCHVPLVPSKNSPAVDETFGSIHTCLTPSLLVKLRTYIGLIQLLPYSLPEVTQKTIEQDFVEARKDDARNMTVDDFHGLLVLARLVSLSHGQTSLSLDLWEKTKLMEAQRKERLPKSTAKTSN